jgi:hypothetical protein
MKITTLLTAADDCPVDRTCPSVHDLDIDPENRYVISKRLTTQGEAALLEPLMEAGEIAGFMPAGFLPAANAMLDRTRTVFRPGLRADRQYVIVREVTDPALVAEFAHLMAADEQLGTVPALVLQEV